MRRSGGALTRLQLAVFGALGLPAGCVDRAVVIGGDGGGGTGAGGDGNPRPTTRTSSGDGASDGGEDGSSNPSASDGDPSSSADGPGSASSGGSTSSGGGETTGAVSAGTTTGTSGPLDTSTTSSSGGTTSGGTTSDGTTGGLVPEPCTIPGEERCHGTIAQMCLADENGRLVWTAEIDCWFGECRIGCDGSALCGDGFCTNPAPVVPGDTDGCEFQNPYGWFSPVEGVLIGDPAVWHRHLSSCADTDGWIWPYQGDPDACVAGTIELCNAACDEFLQEQYAEIAHACSDGRPLVVEAAARMAAPASRGDWMTGDLPISIDGLADDDLERLAAAWERRASAEHASVASFARFVLQLMALGAPADLVEQAERAMGDEIEHARIGYSIASALAGRSIGPGRLDVDGAMTTTTRRDVLIATLVEGCVGETIAAHQLTLAAEQATNPALAEVLSRIAADERRHAALAWAAAHWMVSDADPIALQVARRTVLAAASAEPDPEHVAPGFGFLAPDEHRAAALDCREHVIAPAAQALLG